ncbi:MAG: DUF3352 domain-containing protein [Armatimonadota bacterium]
MLHNPSFCRHWRVMTFGAMLLFGLCAYAQNASLYSFVPLDSPMMMSVDVPQLWQATADLRKMEMVGNGLRTVEAGLGLSMEEEILPWIGQAAVVGTDIRPGDPGWALFLQIREPNRMIGDARLTELIQKILQSGEQVKWLALDIKGVPVRRTEIPRGKSVLKIATITQDGWLVIAFGDGVIRKVIDARNGSIQSLEKHPLYARATGGLPAGAIGRFCVNGQGILAQMEKYRPETAVRYEDSEMGMFFAAGAVSYTNQNLHVESTYCTASPKTQAMLKQFNADFGTISGESLSQLPEGAFATLLLAHPDKWFDGFERILLDASEGPESKEFMRQQFAEFDDLREVLKCCSGEVGISAAFREEKGFGITVAEQTGGDEQATAAVAALNRFLQKMESPIAERENIYILRDMQSNSKWFPTQFCWTARKQWFVGGSHPDWIAQPAAEPALVLPEYAKGANLALFGNLSFLPNALKAMGAPDEIAGMLAMINLGKGEWALTAKIDEDGGGVKCHMTGSLPIIAMSAAVLFPVFAKSRERARTVQSMSNLRQLAMAAQMYAMDREKLPVLKTAADMKEHLGDYLGNSEQMFISPRTGEPYVPNPFVSGKSIGVFDNPTIMIVLYEKTAGSDGSRCAAFLDGHVEVIQAGQWETVRKRSKIP